MRVDKQKLAGVQGVMEKCCEEEKENYCDCWRCIILTIFFSVFLFTGVMETEKITHFQKGSKLSRYIYEGDDFVVETKM